MKPLELDTEYIKALIIKAGGFTPVAEKMGIDRSSLHRWVTGVSLVTLQKINHLAEALKADPKLFFK